MSIPVERARQLVALAADKIAKNGDTDPEARSAAFIAIKHIVTHKLEIVGPGQAAAGAPGSSPHYPSGGAPHPPPWGRGSSPWDGARVDPRGTPAPENWPPASRPAPPPQPSGPPPGYVPRRHARRHTGGAPDMGRIPIPALHNGACPYCRAPWRPGEPVAYKRGLVMTCIGCRNKP